jgi:hypothetical protein
VANTKRGIVGPGGFALVGLEDIPQVRGSGPEAAVNDDIAVEVQLREDLVKIFVCCLNSNSIGRDRDAVELAGGTAIEKHIDRAYHLPATELRAGLSGYYFALVGVVVEHIPEFVEVGLAECLADRFGNPIGEAVRVAKAFAFNKFDTLLFKGDLVQGFNLDISFHVFPRDTSY